MQKHQHNWWTYLIEFFLYFLGTQEHQISPLEPDGSVKEASWDSPGRQGHAPARNTPVDEELPLAGNFTFRRRCYKTAYFRDSALYYFSNVTKTPYFRNTSAILVHRYEPDPLSKQTMMCYEKQLILGRYQVIEAFRRNNRLDFPSYHSLPSNLSVI